MGPEDNPADDVEPTEDEWDAFQRGSELPAAGSRESPGADDGPDLWGPWPDEAVARLRLRASRRPGSSGPADPS